MNRLERFRDARRTKKKYKFLVLLLVMLLIAGLCAADYSVNGLISTDRGIGLLSFQNIDDSYLKINLLNQKFYVNISYLNRDYARIKDRISELLK